MRGWREAERGRTVGRKGRARREGARERAREGLKYERLEICMR